MKNNQSLGGMPLSDFFKINDEVEAQTDRGAAIIAGSFVEEHLRWAIDRKFIELSERTGNRIFEGTGPLSTFNARVLVGFALGIFDKTTREELILISRIRNLFAHTIKPLNFSDETTSGLCKDLQYPQQYLSEHPEEASPRWRFLLSCWFCRSIIPHGVRDEKPSFKATVNLIGALIEARYVGELADISDALPHVPRRTSGQTPSRQ